MVLMSSHGFAAVCSTARAEGLADMLNDLSSKNTPANDSHMLCSCSVLHAVWNVSGPPVWPQVDAD